jgi:farnesyl diphosphate synthase
MQGFKELEDKLQEIGELLYDRMSELLPNTNGVMEDKLFEAMRYSTLSHGKRLRPFLTVITSQLFGVSLASAIQTAAAIEFIHSYSLIHDDLPAIDNDDYRRGQLSCHKKFGEATAILTGDALLTFAFQVLVDESTHRDPAVRVELVEIISKASGFSGMVGGQIIDILAENHKLEYNEIVRLQRMKTGELFAISCEAGAILGRAPRNLRNALKAYANNLGLAFQITDDLLDAEGTREATGKTVKKDQTAGKATLVSCLGIDQAKEHAKMLANQAVEHLAAFKDQAELLKVLAQYVISRSK